jgi:microcystin-dependent protein
LNLPLAKGGGVAANPGQYFSSDYTNTSPPSTSYSGSNTGSAGSGSAHNNVQPTMTLNYLIAV